MNKLTMQGMSELVILERFQFCLTKCLKRELSIELFLRLYMCLQHTLHENFKQCKVYSI